MSVSRSISQIVVFILVWFGLFDFFLEDATPGTDAVDTAAWTAFAGAALLFAGWGVFLAMLRAISNAVRGDK
jgi:uncharacterized membrane protein